MRYLLIVFFLFPSFCSAQTQASYDQAIARFVKYYNAQQGDSIISMWPPEEGKSGWMTRSWGREQLESLHKKYGKILSFNYIGTDTEDSNPGLAVFRTQFSIAGWKTTSLTLDKNGYLGTFRFVTSSDGIDKLLKEKK
jgi:hypothetical protein